MVRLIDDLFLKAVLFVVRWRGKQFAVKLADFLLIETLNRFKQEKSVVPMGLECAIGWLEELL